MSRKKHSRRQSVSKVKATRVASQARRKGLRLWLVALFLLLPALLVSRQSLESFRWPKLLLSGGLGLLSLVLLSFRLRGVSKIDFRSLAELPILRAILPMALVASLGLLTSPHQAQVREALIHFFVALLCLVGWSLALSGAEHRRILRLLAFPALVLSVIGILQYHHWISLFEFQGEVSERIGLTSLAGGAFDLAAYLVIPALIAQACLYEMDWSRPIEKGLGQRFAWALTLLLCLYTMAATQTLSALIALALGSFLLWFPLLPRRRLAASAGVVLALTLVAVLAMQPLRQRVIRKTQNVVSGDLNRALTGRLDGWKTALWMMRQHPWVGVGHGAYRAEFGKAKLDLRVDREKFFRGQHQTFFANAHNELLEVGAEWGLLGLAALAWALTHLHVAVRKKWRRLAGLGKKGRAEAALLYALLAAIGLLALTSFPMRIALVAFPQLLFLSSIFAAEEES